LFPQPNPGSNVTVEGEDVDKAKVIGNSSKEKERKITDVHIVYPIWWRRISFLKENDPIGIII
jgi:hypothetical protein